LNQIDSHPFDFDCKGGILVVLTVVCQDSTLTIKIKRVGINLVQTEGINQDQTEATTEAGVEEG